jgi:uncharacterized membrane protein YeiH
MQYYLEQFGVAVAAVSGVLAAKGKSVDLFGVIVLALVTALGGGTLRDLVLSAPAVFWIQDCSYVLTAVITAVATFFAVRFWIVPLKLFLVADAFVLAFFTILGTSKSLMLSAGMVNAVVLGIITGVAGGIARDVLLGTIPVVFRTETYLYATAAFAGAAVYVILEAWYPGGAVNRPVGIGIIILLRMASIQWKLTLPEFRA